MSYTPRVEGEYIVIDKGIATREMWKRYPHGDELVTYDELAKACQLRNRVPVVLDTDHDHHQPLTDAAASVGFADLAACPDRRGVRMSVHLRKARLPPWLLARITRREPLPVSIYQFTDIVDGQQRNLLFDHLAILKDSTPRCPTDRCGVGVADSNMTEQPNQSEDQPRDDQGRFAKKAEAVPDTVPPVPPEEKKTPPSLDAPVEVTNHDAVQIETLQAEKSALEAEKTRLEAEIADQRAPYEAFLRQRGITDDAITAMRLKDLQTTATALRTQQTQGLPGSVPAPTAEPETYEERKAKAESKFHKDLDEQSKEAFKGW